MTTTKRSRRKGPVPHVVLSDTHIPYHDYSAIKLALEYTRDLKPAGVHLLGDIIDFYSISRYLRDPERATSLQADLDTAKGFLWDVRKAAGKSALVYSAGNHEDRLQKYLYGSAPELSQLRCLDLSGLLDLESVGARLVGGHDPYFIGKLLLTHGQVVRKHSGYSAKAHLEKYGCSVLTGHTHRLGTHYHRSLKDEFVAAENGCLCDLNPEYAVCPDWQHGFSVVWLYPDGTFHLDQMPILNGRVLGGR